MTETQKTELNKEVKSTPKKCAHKAPRAYDEKTKQRQRNRQQHAAYRINMHPQSTVLI